MTTPDSLNLWPEATEPMTRSEQFKMQAFLTVSQHRMLMQ
jgi:hypothetical protein